MTYDRAIALARGDEWRRNVDLALGRLPPPAPDAGGSDEAMAELNAAKERALAGARA